MSHVIKGILCNARSFTSNSDIFSTTVKTVSRNKLDYRQKLKQNKKKKNAQACRACSFQERVRNIDV